MTSKANKRKAAMLALLSTVTTMVAAGTATATVPGQNGRVFFDTNRDGNSEIYSMEADGLDARNLTQNAAFDGDPAVSPDGQKVMFVSNRTGQVDLWTMNVDGSNPVQVTNTPLAESQPAWSPDGSRILFVGDSNGATRIFVANADGSAAKLLVFRKKLLTDKIEGLDDLVATRSMQKASLKPIDEVLPDLDGEILPPPPPPPPPVTPKLIELDPAFSPDGKQVAFASRLDTEDNNAYELWLVNANGFGLKKLTDNAVSDRRPSFSPDGTAIAFTSGKSDLLSRQTIWTLKLADPAQKTQVTTGNGLSFLHSAPAFSPDGSRIVYVRQLQLHVVGATGGTSVPLTQTADGVTNYNPDWQTIGFVPPVQPDPNGGNGQPGGEQPGGGQTGQPGGGQTGGQGDPQPIVNAPGCTITGTPADDVLVGTARRDVICGLGGDDVIRGLGGADVIKGGAGDDELIGGAGPDRIRGGAGDDELRGGAGPDKLFGQAGDDTFFARLGGRDILKGGAGEDDAAFDRIADRLRSVEVAL